MARLSKLSEGRLATCHPKLQRLLREVIRRVPDELDFTVLCGHRGQAEQTAAYLARPPRSTKPWPESLHNALPSLAVDIAPHPIDWEDPARFARLVGWVECIAAELAIKIRWGGDWNGNGRTNDERLVDLPHLELHPDEYAAAA